MKACFDFCLNFTFVHGCAPVYRHTDKYALGTHSRINVRVRVENQGEGSYESMVYVTLPAGVSYVNVDRVQPEVSCETMAG